MLNKFFIIFLLTIFSACVSAEDKDLAKLFEQQGVEGAIVISSLDGEYTFIHNEPGRVGTVFVPTRIQRP